MAGTALVQAKAKAAAIKNKLKGHDKSGQKLGKLRFPVHTTIGGGRPESSKSIQNKVNVCGSPQEVRKNIIRKYKELGYTPGPGNTMLPPPDSGWEVIMLPRLSSIKPMRTGKAGRSMPPQHDRLGGMVF